MARACEMLGVPLPNTPQARIRILCAWDLVPPSVAAERFHVVVAVASSVPSSPAASAAYQQAMELGRAAEHLVFVLAHGSCLGLTKEQCREWTKAVGDKCCVMGLRGTANDVRELEADASQRQLASRLLRLLGERDGTDVVETLLWRGVAAAVETVRKRAERESRLLRGAESEAVSTLRTALDEIEAGVFPAAPVARTLLTVLDEMSVPGVPALVLTPGDAEASALVSLDSRLARWDETRPSTQCRGLVAAVSQLREMRHINEGAFSGVVALMPGRRTSADGRETQEDATLAMEYTCLLRRRVWVACCLEGGPRALSGELVERVWEQQQHGGAETGAAVVTTTMGVAMQQLEDMDIEEQSPLSPVPSSPPPRPSPTSALFCSTACMEDEICTAVMAMLAERDRVDVIPRECLDFCGKRLFNVGPAAAVLLWTDSDMDGDDTGTGVSFQDAVPMGFDARRAAQFAVCTVVVRSRSLRRLEAFTAQAAVVQNAAIRIATCPEDVADVILQCHRAAMAHDLPEALFTYEESPVCCWTPAREETIDVFPLLPFSLSLSAR